MLGQLLGGIGLFLLGMELLNEGLHMAAGDALRAFLQRYTRSRLSGLLFGSLVTAIVQSSTATTVAIVGFVGAGLLPFEQALAVVFGANVGTTGTAWIVSTVGLKVSMSMFALPIVGAGAVVKLFTRGKRSAFGSAVAGFGLIFVAIDVLQVGMAGYASSFDPSRLALGGFGGRIVLVVIGILMSVIMQSSTAAVATTLTAVHSGALTLEQAAALVVGQNIGTTMTAVIAAIGAPAPARRVAAAHCIFNVGTAVIVIAVLPWFVSILDRYVGRGDASLALAAFHSAFSVFGVVVFLPLIGPLARELTRRIPERGASLTARLSRAGAGVPGVAVAAARVTTAEIATRTIALAKQLLRGARNERVDDAERDTIRAALQATREHLKAVRSDPTAPEIYAQHVSVLHAIDHLHRLVEALAEAANAKAVTESPELRPVAESLAESLGREDASRRVAEHRRRERAGVLERTARGVLLPTDAGTLLEGFRWVDRVGYHAWRAVHHVERVTQDPDGAVDREPHGEIDLEAGR